jgi:hypothetical protein
MSHRDNDDDYGGNDEPDYEIIVERRRAYRQEDRTERAERSYERHLQGY